MLFVQGKTMQLKRNDEYKDFSAQLLKNGIIFRPYKNRGYLFGYNNVQVNFNGADHFTFRFSDGFDLEPMRIKLDADLNFDTQNGLLIINKMIALKYS